MNLALEHPELHKTVQTLGDCLLSQRTSQGHWIGCLSSSALSTATAAFALSKVGRHRPLVERGLQWLARNQNADGGWGDTADSPSNLSTTLLAYSALGLPGLPPDCGPSILKAEAWIRRTAGALEPRVLAAAVDRQYGRDKTFSVPILTMAALAGRLGEGRRAWRLIRPLPFELAVFPPGLYRRLRLPVVSYALPALVAMGQAHFALCRPRNPVAAAARSLSRARTLRVLDGLQPSDGGFLEAAPLTSFVLMSLAAAGQASHPVCRRAVEFLAGSIREDGSWPIDTNLATWVTTLSITALSAGGPAHGLSGADRGRLTDWLLTCQHTRVHPYTQAAPGGWAWSDLAGAVPDADDTAGALLALRHLAADREDCQVAAAQGIQWLMDLQNRDGGIPTFCRGWTELPFDKSSPDLTAHALGGMRAWLPDLPPSTRPSVIRSMGAALRYLKQVQQPDGSWIPLWFGNQETPGHVNPVYGTSRALTHLARQSVWPGDCRMPPMLSRAIRWLLSAQNTDGGWGGAPSARSTIEETALAVDALAESYLFVQGQDPDPVIEVPLESFRSAVLRGAAWLVAATDQGRSLPPSPIGLYFAHLWYHERLYPVVFALGALNKVVRVVQADLGP